jgi:multiple sugar transport system substrate-binding protein
MTRAHLLLHGLLLAVGCSPADQRNGGVAVITFPGSTLGSEGDILRRQIARFNAEHPGIRVEQRATPDAADQRHQLYVQWLNARAGEPDILQLDVVWTPEFAAAGWILPLDRFHPDTSAFFPATLAANRWQDRLYAIPWFVDVGMLYWRTDLMASAPRAFAAIHQPLGWQGARYEGLVTVFLEYLGGHGGAILDGGRVVVNSEAGIRALTRMRDQIHHDSIVPRAALTWHEEETRFAFQNGTLALMRNWPYAFSLMADSTQSRVAGRYAVAPMPAEPGGTPTAALGGAQLAISAWTEHPEAAWQVVEYLTRPDQMRERAEALGQFPTRPALYDDPALAAALPIPPPQALAVIRHATPRPVTPVYTQLSGMLQIHLHRALTLQESPQAALDAAAGEMQTLLDRTGLGPGPHRAR